MLKRTHLAEKLYRGRFCAKRDHSVYSAAVPAHLIHSVVPEGYARSLPVDLGTVSTTTLTIPVVHGGRVVIQSVDVGQTAVLNTCYTALRDHDGDGNLTSFERACDADDGSVDGVTTIPYLVPDDGWSSSLRGPITEAGFTIQAPLPFSIAARHDTELTYTLHRRPKLTIFTVDESHRPLVGACFDFSQDYWKNLPWVRFRRY